jgi:hypothetical protein
VNFLPFDMKTNWDREEDVNASKVSTEKYEYTETGSRKVKSFRGDAENWKMLKYCHAVA